MKRDDIRQRLIDGTIHVIAEEGLEKVTTKQIGQVTQTNEAYIYRCFANKEDLLANTFAYLDEELAGKTLEHITVMYKSDISFDERAWLFFSAIWKFMLGNREKCLAFIRYYYSPYMERYSAEEHRRRFEPLFEQFKGAFSGQANTWMLMNHILSTMLDFAVKVYDGHLPDDADTAEHVFYVTHDSMRRYFRTEEESTHQ